MIILSNNSIQARKKNRNKMINLDIQNDVAHIELNDGKANVFSPAMIESFNEALDKAETNAKAVVIRGSGDKFSAGFDLSVMQQGGNAQWQMILNGFALLLRLYQHPQPVISAVGGHALGMGAFTLLVSDTRIGIEGDYKLGLPETAGNMQFTNFLVSILKAELNPMFMKSAALQSQFCNPKSAVHAGFLDLVVPAEQLDATIAKASEGLKQLPLKQYAHNKLELRQDNIDTMQARLNALKAKLLS